MSREMKRDTFCVTDGRTDGRIGYSSSWIVKPVVFYLDIVKCGRGSNPCVKVAKLESVNVFEQFIKYFAWISDPETIVGAMVHQWFL